MRDKAHILSLNVHNPLSLIDLISHEAIVDEKDASAEENGADKAESSSPRSFGAEGIHHCFCGIDRESVQGRCLGLCFNVI